MELVRSFQLMRAWVLVRLELILTLELVRYFINTEVVINFFLAEVFIFL